MFELRKIGIVKRLSAWFLDAILLAVLTTGFMFLISLICNFNYEQDLETVTVKCPDGTDYSFKIIKIS